MLGRSGGLESDVDRMTARVFCAVLLCLSGCLSSTEVAPGLNLTEVKPEVCPRGKIEAELCALIRYVPCGDDSDCAKNEKCCHNGCGLQCVAPVPEVKPGVCPSKRYTAKECTWIRFVSCADDSDCSKKEKCCSNGCGLQCVAPVPEVKPGVCPQRYYIVPMCDELCADDSDCTKNDKCCSTGCGHECMPPVPEVKPGVCPNRRYTAKECARIRFVPCADDSDCAKKEKCCSNGCGLQCMAPVPVKPGVCPRKKYDAAMCARIRFRPCVDDSDCVKKEKCCSNGCGLECMAPVKVPVLN